MPYNLEKLEELSGGDRDFIVSVVSVFVEETPSDLQDLEQAVKAGNYDAVYKQAHKIKPNVDLLGMEGTKSLILQMEGQAKMNDGLPAIEEMYTLIAGQVREVITELKTDFSL
ncbi:Hpt domain-containing protein [Sinomicrobium weinanense]|uniref:Hpt domain-containing protein n=1 Tax=Sinomicrobium weinanense TaxID=2842200 RepID=A0A926JTL1_9FLAO|nr:Hpt domain-containing protein [Sinomicrobium weinanense]MBC9796956.1 Hpt domain-containing protein [Sinomicrobium weinanense]MBU3124958.1 Hpt domain-containing protein [Sinomicrobium weinanense]